MKSQVNLEGNVVLVTGATAGIGLETARALAQMGATVVGVGRSAERCAAAEAELRREAGAARVTYLRADLAARAEVRGLADEFWRRHRRLDVLVNNAGAYYARRQVSADGIELTWALNHLSYFLLTLGLLDILKASAPARIVNVSSGAHFGGRIHFDDLEGRRRYDGFAAYSQSKLANVLFTYELARRLAGAGVTVNALHPGFVATRFGHDNGGLMAAGMRLLQRLLARTPAQGAATSIYLASSPEVTGVTGKYFADEKEQASSPESYDAAAARRLWEVSEEMTGQRVHA